MATTEYVFNAAGQRVSEWNGATHAQLKGKYYWGAKPVAYYANGSTHFEHQDWLGTERLRTTYNGGVEGSYNSLPFGDGQAVSGADTDANHYAMLDHDVETDTDSAQFRQYSEAQGRWLSPDPYRESYQWRNPQSFNRYAYVGNNPLAGVDPSGLDENQFSCIENQNGTYNCSGNGVTFTMSNVTIQNGVITYGDISGISGLQDSQTVGVDANGNALDTERLDPRSFGTSVGSYQSPNDRDPNNGGDYNGNSLNYLKRKPTGQCATILSGYEGAADKVNAKGWVGFWGPTMTGGRWPAHRP